MDTIDFYKRELKRSFDILRRLCNFDKFTEKDKY